MFFLSIDLTSRTFQSSLKEESQNLTNFITPMGLSKSKQLPEGLVSEPGSFENLLELVFIGFSHEIALVYLEDVFVFEKHFMNIYYI